MATIFFPVSGRYSMVMTFADLPPANQHPNEIWVVLTTTGIIFINYHVKGFYYSNGVAWELMPELSPIAIDSTTRTTFTGVLVGAGGYVTTLGYTPISPSDLSTALASYVPYTGATGNVDLGAHNFTVATNTLFVDSTTHKVGIGTITPSGSLEVKGIYQEDNIPAMSNFTVPSPLVASASTSLAGYYAWSAFDKSKIQIYGWVSNTVPSGWLKLDLGNGTPKTITSYTLTNVNEPSHWDKMPKTWTFEGSNNDSTWTTLDTQTNAPAWTFNAETRQYTIASPASFRYYRINVSTNQVGSNYLMIMQLRLLEPSTSKQRLLIDDYGSVIVKGIVGQWNVAQQWQNSTGTVLASIGSLGEITAKSLSVSTAIFASNYVQCASFYFLYTTGALYNSLTIPLIAIAAGDLISVGQVGSTSKFEVIQPQIGVGTVINTAGSTAVVGTGTVFRDTFKIGDTITIAGETRTVSNIASDTTMTTNAWTNEHRVAQYTVSGGVRLAVKGNGRIGIGTATPQTALEVVGDYNTFIMRAPTASGYGSFSIYNDQNSSARALEIGLGGSSYESALVTGGFTGETAYITTTGAKSLQFGVGKNFVAGFDTNGKFGVGKNAPAYKLDVAGDINISAGYNFKINGVNFTGGSGLALDGTDVGATTQAQNFTYGVYSPDYIQTDLYMKEFGNFAEIYQTMFASNIITVSDDTPAKLDVIDINGFASTATTDADNALITSGDVRGNYRITFTGAASSSVKTEVYFLIFVDNSFVNICNSSYLDNSTKVISLDGFASIPPLSNVEIYAYQTSGGNIDLTYKNCRLNIQYIGE